MTTFELTEEQERQLYQAACLLRLQSDMAAATRDAFLQLRSEDLEVFNTVVYDLIPKTSEMSVRHSTSH